jgi:hypothetical protein
VATSTIRELDAVALRRPHGRWVAGTTGAVVETFGDQAALVELVGPDGRTLDMLTVPLGDLVLVRRPGSARGSGPDRLAG